MVENLLKGRYEFVVSKEGYVSESGGIDIDGQDCEREVSLLNKHTLTFDIKDDNGQVIVDAIITQLEATPIVFPAGQYIIPNLYYNWTHDFRIEKAGYETIEKKTITITGDETVPITLRKYYTVTFTVTGDKDGSLNDAVVKLGNTTNPVGNYTFKDLFKGDYDYEVKRNEYITKTGSLTITSDNVREVVELKYDNNGIGDTYFGGVKTYYNKFTQEVIVNDPEQVVKSVLITNSAGKHVINMNLNGNNTIYVGELPQGIYVVTLMTAEGKTITAKMVK